MSDKHTSPWSTLYGSFRRSCRCFGEKVKARDFVFLLCSQWAGALKKWKRAPRMTNTKYLPSCRLTKQGHSERTLRVPPSDVCLFFTPDMKFIPEYTTKNKLTKRKRQTRAFENLRLFGTGTCRLRSDVSERGQLLWWSCNCAGYLLIFKYVFVFGGGGNGNRNETKIERKAGCFMSVTRMI